MHRFVLVLFILSSAACAEHREPSAPVASKAVAPSNAASMASMPIDVQHALVSLCGGCTFADFNAPWNPGDEIADDTPQRHLTKVEHRGSEWLIQYEHGGIGKHDHTIVFALVPTIHTTVGTSCMPAESKSCEW
jgi:hypothetical protein